MRIAIITLIFLLINENAIGQNMSKILFQNATIYTTDSVSEQQSVINKNKVLHIISHDNINENSIFLLNDTVYSILQFEEIVTNLNSEKKLNIYASQKDIDEYLREKNVSNLLNSDYPEKNLLFILENR